MRKVAVVVAGVPVPPLDNYLKRLKINYILIGVVTLLLALALWPNITGAAAVAGNSEIISRGELRISTLNSPLTYFNTKQGPGGLDYELAKRFANYLGVKLVVIPIRTSMTCSTIWTTTTPTCWRPALSTTRAPQPRAHRPGLLPVSQQLVYRLGTLRQRLRRH